jgi:hypothetical protein
MIKFHNDTDNKIFFSNSSFPHCISNGDVLMTELILYKISYFVSVLAQTDMKDMETHMSMRMSKIIKMLLA